MVPTPIPTIQNNNIGNKRSNKEDGSETRVTKEEKRGDKREVNWPPDGPKASEWKQTYVAYLTVMSREFQSAGT